MAIITMTAATPMMIPSMERKERALLLSIALRATFSRLAIDTLLCFLVVLWQRESCESLGCTENIGILHVLTNLSVAEYDVA